MFSSFCHKAQEQPAQLSLLVALPKGFLGPICSLMVLLSKTSDFYWMFQQICYSRAPPVHYGCEGSRSLFHAGAVHFGCHTLGKVLTGGYLSSLDAVSFKFLLAIMSKDINWSCFSMFVQSVMMLMLQNVSLPQMPWVLLTKCFFFSTLSTSFYRFLENIRQ